VVNAADEAVRLGLRFDDVADGQGERLVPVDLTGFGQAAETPIVDGRAEIDVGPRTGTVLRIA
jgi:hypothetical protein